MGSLPLGDIPTVLDELPQANLTTRASRRNEWEVARFIDRVLIRAWRGIADIEPGSAAHHRRCLFGGQGGAQRRDNRHASAEMDRGAVTEQLKHLLFVYVVARIVPEHR